MAESTEIHKELPDEAADEEAAEPAADSAERPSIADAIPTVVPHPAERASEPEPGVARMDGAQADIGRLATEPAVAEALDKAAPEVVGEGPCTGSAVLPAPSVDLPESAAEPVAEAAVNTLADTDAGRESHLNQVLDQVAQEALAPVSLEPAQPSPEIATSTEEPEADVHELQPEPGIAEPEAPAEVLALAEGVAPVEPEAGPEKDVAPPPVQAEAVDAPHPVSDGGMPGPQVHETAPAELAGSSAAHAEPAAIPHSVGANAEFPVVPDPVPAAAVSPPTYEPPPADALPHPRPATQAVIVTPFAHYAAGGAAMLRPATAAAPSIPVPSGDTLDRIWRYLRLAAKAAAAVVLALTLLVLGLVIAYRWVDPPASTLMLAQRLDGIDIQQTWVPLRQISPNLVRAVVVSEDGGFCRHRGVDWPALVDALETSRGGSTITMQLVKNLFLWPSRSYVRKAIEIMLAYLVEALWPKERILEVYLNVAEWGEGIFGAEAAARHHFGIPAARLTAAEAALLAVSLPNPIVREAGTPGPGARRLASNLQVRMRAAPAATSCVLVRRTTVR